MFISAWKYPFLKDDLASTSTGGILSADITEDLLTAYQKDKAAYIQCNEESFHKLGQITFCTITAYQS